MKKSNSKDLYKLAKKLKAKQNNIPTVQDSLQIIPKQAVKKKITHFRSQSCPFNGQSYDQKFNHLQQREVNNFGTTSVSAYKKKGSRQSINSQASMSGETVIIKEVPFEHLSVALFRKNNKGKKQLSKKSMTGFKSDSYTRTKVGQQMRSYQLRRELQLLRKQSESAQIKHKIMEKLLQGCDIFEESFQFA